jgi:hypothetical protein
MTLAIVCSTFGRPVLSRTRPKLRWGPAAPQLRVAPHRPTVPWLASVLCSNAGAILLKITVAGH